MADTIVIRLGCQFVVTRYVDKVQTPEEVSEELVAEMIADAAQYIIDYDRSCEEKYQRDVATLGRHKADINRAIQQREDAPKYPMGTNYALIDQQELVRECQRGQRTGRGLPEFMPQLDKCHAPGLRLDAAKFGGAKGDKTVGEVETYDSVITDY